MKLSLKPSRLPAGLPIRPVLESGLIVYASAYLDGTRIVSFEDPSRAIQRTVYHGSGKDADTALTQALRSFYAVPANRRKGQLQNKRPPHIAYLTGKLDIWLTKHKGQMHAVCDEDGTVLVRLKGLVNPTDTHHVMLEGSGKTFYSALVAALVQYRHHRASLLAD